MRKQRICDRVMRRFGSDASMLARVNSRLKDRFGYSCTGGTSDPTEPTVPVVEQVELRVARAPFHPIGDTVAKGSSHIPALSTVFSASCAGDIVIDDVTVSNFGPGLLSDISAVWIEIDGSRVSRARILNRDRTVQLRFKRPLTIPACESVSLDVKASISKTALGSARHAFAIDSGQDIFANGVVTGDFPVEGERFTVGTNTTGTMTVTHLPFDNEPRVDGSDREVLGRFRVDMDTTEDQTIHSVTLEQKGSAMDGDVMGVYLRSTQGRARFTTVAEHFVNDLLTLFFEPPYPVEKGEHVELDVVGNVVWNTGGTLQIGLFEPADIYGIGSRFGFGRNGQLYGSEAVITNEPYRVTIRGN